MSAAPSPDQRTPANRAEVEALVGRMARRLDAEQPALRCQSCELVASPPRVDYDPPLDAILCTSCLRERDREDKQPGIAELLVNMDAAMQLAELPIVYAIEPIAPVAS